MLWGCCIAERGPEGLLEAPSEVLIEVAVDDGVGAAVEEGQPVGKGKDIAGDQVQLVLTEVPVVCQQHQCPEGQPGEGEEESMWVRMKVWAGMADITVGVYYRSCNQEDEVNAAFYKQLEVALQSGALVLMGDFNHPGICWVSSTARHMWSRWFLQYAEDDVLAQVVEEPIRQGVLLDPAPSNRNGLVRDVKVRGSLGCSDCEMVEFRTLCGRRKALNKIATLNFRRASFDHFKGLLGGIPSIRAL